MQPLELRPAIKDYIWGGVKLREKFGKESALDRLAESWELSCHPDGESVIASGEYAGKTLSQYLRENPGACGKACKGAEDFPVLVKLIDAKTDLSVQVHPDDAYARSRENDNGKTEMWYVVEAEEGAELIYGFKKSVSKEGLRKALEDGSFMELVNRVPVKKGDVFFIPPGTLHAIGGGMAIAEIQQSSNVTYRVYDYGRLGADGKPRELHVEKALDVVNCEAVTPPSDNRLKNKDGAELEVVRECGYFYVRKLESGGSYRLEASEESFTHLLFIEGEGAIEYEGGSLPFRKGSSVFVPAGDGAFDIKGACSAIITTKIQEEKK